MLVGSGCFSFALRRNGKLPFHAHLPRLQRSCKCIAVPTLLFVALHFAYRGYGGFVMDAYGDAESFEPILSKYLKLAEIAITLASGSIIALIGAYLLRGNSQHLPWYFATPLFLMVFTILYSVTFSVWIVAKYEAWKHHKRYSRNEYIVSNTLGFSGFACFVIGYVWLISRVVN